MDAKYRKSVLLLIGVTVCVSCLFTVSQVTAATVYKAYGYHESEDWYGFGVGAEFVDTIEDAVGYYYAYYTYNVEKDHAEWYSPDVPFQTRTLTGYDFPALESKFWTEHDQRCLPNDDCGSFTYTSEETYSKTREQSFSSSFSVSIGLDKLGSIDAGISATDTVSHTWSFSNATAETFNYMVPWGKRGTPYSKRRGIMSVYRGTIVGAVYSAQGNPPDFNNMLKSSDVAGAPHIVYVSMWTWSVGNPMLNWNLKMGCNASRGGCGHDDVRCNGSSCWKYGSCAHHGAYAGDPCFIQPDARVKVRN